VAPLADVVVAVAVAVVPVALLPVVLPLPNHELVRRIQVLLERAVELVAVAVGLLPLLLGLALLGLALLGLLLLLTFRQELVDVLKHHRLLDDVLYLEKPLDVLVVVLLALLHVGVHTLFYFLLSAQLQLALALPILLAPLLPLVLRLKRALFHLLLPLRHP
jgi:hypothetical protein